MRPAIRNLLASLLIAAVAPMALAALDLEQPAYAKNGNGGGNGGGHGGDHGNGHGDNAKGGNAKGQTKAADAGTGDESEGEGLAPNELGKLNGVLHASPNAIANASANSPIGTAREFGEALADFLDSTTEDTTTEGETEETDQVTVDELGEMMARMTNKPVTADQVQAVAEKLGIETTDEAPTDETTDEQTSEGEGEQAPALDQETAQEIADKANEIHVSEDTADAGDTDGTGDADEESVTN
jgi:hypothetical protein